MNRTPLAPVGQQALAFLDPVNRLTWAPHAIDAFTLGFAPDHYRLLRFWNKLTGGCLTTGTYALYPAYCRVPAISEGDRTVMAAAELLDLFKTIVPRNTNEKVKYCDVIEKLTNTLSECQAPQRMANQTVQPQRVATTPTDSHTPTSHKAVQAAPQIHERKTRCNTPFEEIAEQMQTMENRAGHEAPDPATQTPTTPVRNT